MIMNHKNGRNNPFVSRNNDIDAKGDAHYSVPICVHNCKVESSPHQAYQVF